VPGTVADGFQRTIPPHLGSIAHPFSAHRSVNPTEVRFGGSRDEAIAAAGARIDRWLKRQRETEKEASSLPRTDC